MQGFTVTFSKWPPLCLSNITFLSITFLLWQVEMWFLCLSPCFDVPGIHWIHPQCFRTFTFNYIWKLGQYMFKLTPLFTENLIFRQNSAYMTGWQLYDLILVSLPKCTGTQNSMSRSQMLQHLYFWLYLKSINLWSTSSIDAVSWKSHFCP